jgi:hypothetical protein
MEKEEKRCDCRCHLPLKTTHLCPNCFDGKCEKEEFVDVEETYNPEGVLIKRTINGVDFEIPEKLKEPHVLFWPPVVNWKSYTTHTYMTKEEFNNTFDLPNQ